MLFSEVAVALMAREAYVDGEAAPTTATPNSGSAYDSVVDTAHW